MNHKTAIVLDDHKLFGESFSVLLERYTQFETVHTFHEPSGLIRLLKQNSRKTFYLFLDYYLQNNNGLSVLTDVKRINKLCKIIFVTASSSWPVLHNIENHAPEGIISKLAGLDVLIECIEQIEAGNPYRCPVFQEMQANNIAKKPILFTSRELEILKYIASGLTIAETAEKTFLSRHTIVSHRRNMMAKAKVTSIGQLLIYVNEWNLI